MTGNININQSCASCNASATSTLTLLLYSDSAGNYTCTTSDSEPSEIFTVTVVGELYMFPIHVFFSGKLCPLVCSLVVSFCRFGRIRSKAEGDSYVKSLCLTFYAGAGIYAERKPLLEAGGPVGNNGVIVSGSSGLRLECVSNSSQNGLGTVTTPSGAILTPPTTTPTWTVSGPATTPGLLAIETFSPISPSQQGIYTCIIPDSNGNDIILNIGIYPHGFNGENVVEKDK